MAGSGYVDGKCIPSSSFMLACGTDTTSELNGENEKRHKKVKSLFKEQIKINKRKTVFLFFSTALVSKYIYSPAPWHPLPFAMYKAIEIYKVVKFPYVSHPL